MVCNHVPLEFIHKTECKPLIKLISIVLVDVIRGYNINYICTKDRLR